MDYFISSDHFEPPLGQGRFNEQLVRFDSLNFFFVAPDVKELMQNKTSLRASRKTLFGGDTLPGESGKIILVPQTLYKFHPKYDGVLEKLLTASSNSAIVITYNYNKPVWKVRRYIHVG